MLKYEGVNSPNEITILGLGLPGFEKTPMVGSKECNPANKHELWNGYVLGQRICFEQVDPNRTQIGSTFWAFVGSPLSRAKKVNFLNVLQKEF